MRAERFSWHPGVAARAARAGARRRVGGRRRGGDRATRCATGGDAALREFVRRLRRRRRRRCASGARADRARRRRCAPGSRSRSPTCARWPQAGARRRSRSSTLPQGHTVLAARAAGAARGDLRAGRARAVSVDGRDGRRDRAGGAGVEEVVVCAPGAHPVILAACALCGVDEVYAMGGAHAVAALAYGTESIERVDVIAGPGNLYVQEAKRQCSSDVGIDGFAGPSDVLVLATGAPVPGVASLDLAAQAEHGRRDDRGGGERRSGAARMRSTSSPATRSARSWTCRTWRPGWSWRTRSRPSTSSWSATRPRRSRRACAAPAACSSARRAARRSATTSPAPTTACRPAARRASPPGWARGTSAGA